MRYKSAELEGALLDAAVTLAAGGQLGGEVNPGTPRTPLAYSTDWEYGGPIIERELIDLTYIGGDDECRWVADADEEANGPTPLIAAMRAYVTSKLGEEVELP